MWRGGEETKKQKQERQEQSSSLSRGWAKAVTTCAGTKRQDSNGAVADGGTTAQ